MGTYVIMKEDYGIFKKGLVYRCIGIIGNDESPTDFSIETSDRKHNVCIKQDKAEIFKGVAYKCNSGDYALLRRGRIYPENYKLVSQKSINDLVEAYPKDWEKIDCRTVEEKPILGYVKVKDDFKGHTGRLKGGLVYPYYGKGRAGGYDLNTGSFLGESIVTPFHGVAYKCIQVVGDPAIKVGNIYPEDHKDLWIWQKGWPEYFEKIDCRNGNKEEEVSLKTGYVIAKKDSRIKGVVLKGQVYPAKADTGLLIKLDLPNGDYFHVAAQGSEEWIEDFEGVAYKCTAPDGEYVNFKNGEIYPEDFKLNDHTDKVKGIAEVCPEEWEKIDCSPKKKKQADFIKAAVAGNEAVRNLSKALCRFNRSEIRESDVPRLSKSVVEDILYSVDPEGRENLHKLSNDYLLGEEDIPKGHSDFKGRVSAQLDIIKEMLVEKNRKYGNSALEPIRVFSKASAIEQIKVRLDDKLSRLKTQDIEEDEDVLKDLIGYLVLLSISLQGKTYPPGGVIAEKVMFDDLIVRCNWD